MNVDAGERFVGRQVLRDALQPGPRWLAAIAAAILVFVPVWAYAAQPETALLAAWDAGILACLMVTFLTSRTAPTGQSRSRQPARASRLMAITIAAAVGLLGALALAGQIGKPESAAQSYRVGLAMAAVVESWLLVRTECRLHFARLRHERKETLPARKTTLTVEACPAELDIAKLGFWEFIYYAFPIARLHNASDPAPITAAMCRVAILQSVMTYASVAVLVSFGLSLIGPGLDGARVVLGG